MYANKSHTKAMQLKEEITLIKRGDKTIQDYLHTVKSLTNEIALIDRSKSDDDLTLHILNGLGLDFHEIATTIQAREKSLTFEELHDLLMGHEGYLCRLEATTQQLVATVNFTHRRFGLTRSMGKINNPSWGFYKEQGQQGPSCSLAQNHYNNGSRDNQKQQNAQDSQWSVPFPAQVPAL